MVASSGWRPSVFAGWFASLFSRLLYGKTFRGPRWIVEPARAAPIGQPICALRGPLVWAIILMARHLLKTAHMMLVKTEKRRSAIHGLGLFAVELIPAGTPTWRFTPGLDLAIHQYVVAQMNSHNRPWFLTYVYWDIRTGLYVLCADDARYMNHSNDPTVIGDYEHEEVFGLDVAARDYRAGRGADVRLSDVRSDRSPAAPFRQ
jgi:uncharacterized protein